MVHSVDQDTVYALAATPDFARDGLCFAARRSGLWRTENGERWQKIRDIPGASDGLPVTAIAVSPGFRSSDGTVFAAVPGGILRSSDGGNRWELVALSSPAPVVSVFAMSPNFEADGVILAATLEDGIFRSDDRGATWQAWNIGLFDLSVWSIALSPAFAHDRTVYAGVESGIFCSRNGGRAWQETGFPDEHAPVLSLALSPRFAHDGVLFAVTDSGGLFYSEDCGQTWQQKLDSKAINTILLSPDFSNTPEILAVSSDKLWLSHDGGKTWANRDHDRGPGVGYTTAVAPYGLVLEGKLLLGLSDGQVVWA
jgi:photosystem II stability/assembly factor-like uncharacterized protein